MARKAKELTNKQALLVMIKNQEKMLEAIEDIQSLSSDSLKVNRLKRMLAVEKKKSKRHNSFLEIFLNIIEEIDDNGEIGPIQRTSRGDDLIKLYEKMVNFSVSMTKEEEEEEED